MTLHPSEIERIRIDAQKAFPITDTSTFSGLMQDFYVSGAQAEAVRGREMMVAFAEWITENADGYHGKVGIHWYLRLQEDDTKHTTAELLDLYILDTQKRKG